MHDFEWEPSFSVGHELLDAQHRQLLSICHEVARSLEIRSPPAEERFLQVLQRLKSYADGHFLHEERLLRQVQYPALQSQEADHEGFRDILVGIELDASYGFMDQRSLSATLFSWWRTHILVEDMKYRPYFTRPTSADPPR